MLWGGGLPLGGLPPGGLPPGPAPPGGAIWLLPLPANGIIGRLARPYCYGGLLGGLAGLAGLLAELLGLLLGLGLLLPRRDVTLP